MDFNEIGPSNTSPDTNSPLPPTDATGFEQQLNGAQGGAAPHRTASPALPGEPYSPYLDAGHPYSPYLDARHPFSPYLDIAQPYSPGLGWEDDSHAPAALGADPAPERSPHHLSQQTIAQAIEAHPDFDQDLLWQDMDKNPSHAGPSQAGPSEVVPPELSEFRMRDGRLAKDYWVFMGQTATSAQIDMLERSGVLPPKTTRPKSLPFSAYLTRPNGETRASFASRQHWTRAFGPQMWTKTGRQTRGKIRPPASAHSFSRDKGHVRRLIDCLRQQQEHVMTIALGWRILRRPSSFQGVHSICGNLIEIV
ncbi:hypothetical protein [Bradyrhizobium sp. 2S1]|uniref:hypothetical protein n=1 Tax=Bradyrhizobium sp. 2S1 TaxID=1404429 RepID=UPI00140D792B|nr:hypothetical protein [Bradyrhizobium sp. 2S1]MCK7672659.1 hypothetical protein [Bradyrhizobium sp. 2S1]